MKSQHIDEILLAWLNELPYFSRLGTCLMIRLSDYAAQINGFRSTRQMNENKIEEIDEQYNYLLRILEYQIAEAVDYLNKEHIYNKDILDLNDNLLEDLLLETLFNMTIMDCKSIFEEAFFK